MGVSLLASPTSIGGNEVRGATRSISFNGRDYDSDIKSPSQKRKLRLQGSISFNGRELERKFLEENVNHKSINRRMRAQLPDSGSQKNIHIRLSECRIERHEAALKLQKTYKSFRIRRQLADCAVLVEQRWWKLLDFAELKHSSISFFEIEKETATSRWSRARTRAAKVGKGLSKDEKARKLALQHWLEAIDPRHRYGHNLQFYYAKWLHCDSKQPFFYWLDVGEGKEVTLDQCSRSKLHSQCIKYLGPIEREAYEVIVEEGKFMYKQGREVIDTRGGPPEAKWIFVLSTSKNFYVGLKKKGTFQHSSFLAGGATLSAGRLVVEDGILKAVWPHSGHYLPTEENFDTFISFLLEKNVDLSIVKKCSGDGEEEPFFNKASGPGLRSIKSEADLNKEEEEEDEEEYEGEEVDRSNKRSYRARTKSRKPHFEEFENLHLPMLTRSKFHSMITALQIPNREDVIQVFKHNLYDEDSTELAYKEPVPKEKILKRINSHKLTISYQLAQHLQCKWTTGAGPRIGCVRDYPSELQFQVLEEVSLSPRSKSQRFPRMSPRVPYPPNMCRGSAERSPITPEHVILSQMATP